MFDAEDTSIAAAKSIVVEVQSSDLIPRIKGMNFIGIYLVFVTVGEGVGSGLAVHWTEWSGFQP